MYMFCMGFLAGVVFSIILIIAGVILNDRSNKGEHDTDSDMRVYVPSRDRDRSGSNGSIEYMEAEEVINGLQTLRMAGSRKEKEYLDVACDCVLTIERLRKMVEEGRLEA